MTRGREVVSRQAHNLEIAGAIPAPATLRLASLAQCKREAKEKCPERVVSLSNHESKDSSSQDLFFSFRSFSTSTGVVKRKKMIMWHVYTIKCKDESFYTGVTSDLKRRFTEHKEGRGGRYTSLHKPEKVIFLESFSTESEALKREKQLKGWSHRKKDNLVKFGKP